MVLSMLPPIRRAGDEALELVKKAGWPPLDGGLRRYAAHVRAAAAGVLVRDAGGDHAAEREPEPEAFEPKTESTGAPREPGARRPGRPGGAAGVPRTIDPSPPFFTRTRTAGHARSWPQWWRVRRAGGFFASGMAGAKITQFHNSAFVKL